MITVRETKTKIDPCNGYGNFENRLPRRRTLKNQSTFKGVGVHSGDSATIHISPAPFGSGITFICNNTRIKADYNVVNITPMATSLVHENGTKIHTIEHLMAAFYGCGITDATVTLIDGQEIPIMDGSSEPFIEACSAWEESSISCNAIEIIAPIEVEKGNSYARFTPSLTRSFSFTYNPDSSFHAYTKGQTATFECSGNILDFKKFIAPARTFGFFEDGQKLQAMGLAQGASLQNTVVLHNNTVMNEEGLRMPNEMLQHKLLDAMGDIALWGGLIYGHFEGINSGHALNNALLKKLATQSECWRNIA